MPSAWGFESLLGYHFLKESFMNGFEIHFDMDGVHADFELAIEEVAGKPISELTKDEIYSISDTEGFFSDLQVMPGSKELLTFAAEHGFTMFINSSVGTRNPERVEKEKREFLDLRCKGYHFEDKYFVTTSKDKGLYAHEKAILVDDRQKCVDAFEAAGGIAILHVDHESTIAKIKEIVGLED